MGKDKVVVVRGKLHWAKVLGAARPYKGNPKYDKGPSWSVDVTPNAESRELIEQMDFDEKLKTPNKKNEKETRKETFLSLKVLENRADGEKNRPPRVVDARGNEWPNDKLLGNETVADVKVKVVDYGSGSEKGVYLQAIRVLEHVPYESEDFAPLSEDDEFFAATAEDEGEDECLTADDEDLDDDVPF